jgi:hypothetical protein
MLNRTQGDYTFVMKVITIALLVLSIGAFTVPAAEAEGASVRAVKGMDLFRSADGRIQCASNQKSVVCYDRRTSDVAFVTHNQAWADVGDISYRGGPRLRPGQYWTTTRARGFTCSPSDGGIFCQSDRSNGSPGFWISRSGLEIY